MSRSGHRRRGLCPKCGRDVALSAVYVREVNGVRGDHGWTNNHQPPPDAKPETTYVLAGGRRYCKGGLARPLREA